MTEATLAQVLKSREDRARLQEEMRRTHGCAVVSYTMNIAGPIKNSPLITRAFDEGVRLLDEEFAPLTVLHRDVKYLTTGCQALYAVQAEARLLKHICIKIEEAAPLGRLFDIDVISQTGEKLSRADERGCIVCGAPGRACAAGRRHDVGELQAVTRRIITEHFLQKDSGRIAALALQSLLDEVYATPKPGLVDRRNTGSHRDMDAALFEKSARALEPYLQLCVQLGQRTAQAEPPETFALLRQAGLAAEKSMYAATHGVNTHKGAIFSLGVLCGALGRLWTAEKKAIPLPALFDACAQLTQKAMEKDLSTAVGDTAGQRYYLQTGCRGVRGEAASGFATVRHVGWPAFEKGLCAGLERERAGVCALIYLIARTEDSALYHRGGARGAAYAMEAARQLLAASPFPAQQDIEALDDAFIARNLSPGGCADLLAVIFFLDHLRTDGYTGA